MLGYWIRIDGKYGEYYMRKDLLQLGMLIDKAKSLNDVPKIREYLDILKNYVTNDLRHNEKIYFHYIMLLHYVTYVNILHAKWETI